MELCIDVVLVKLIDEKHTYFYSNTVVTSPVDIMAYYTLPSGPEPPACQIYTF